MTNQQSDKLSEADEKRLSDLFNRLDVDNDNKISISDLTKAIKAMENESYRHPDHYQVIIILAYKINCFLLISPNNTQ